MKQLALLVGCLFVVATGLIGVCGQERQVSLKDKRISIQMDKKPLFDVFMRLIYEYDVAIGFEQSVLDSEHNDYHFETNIPYDEPITLMPNGSRRVTTGARPIIDNHLITVYFNDARLEDVMNAIVRQMRNYDWVIEDDVVNIFPVRGRDPVLVKLLDLKIREFVFPKDGKVGLIQPVIVIDMPEFKTFLEQHNLYAEAVKTAPWFNDRPLPAGMKFVNISFRELLNSITKSKRGGWILKSDQPKTAQDKKVIDILI